MADLNYEYLRHVAETGFFHYGWRGEYPSFMCEGTPGYSPPNLFRDAFDAVFV